MVWNIFKHDNVLVEVMEVKIAAIPALRFRPKGTSSCLPTVVYYHGWRSSKEFMRFSASILASYGYQVVVPDAPKHGAREPLDFDQPDALDQFWPVVCRAVQESKGVLDAAVDNHDADPKRIAVMGSSMGGFIASGVFAANPSVSCLVTFNGACSWLKAEEVFSRDAGQKRVDSLLAAELSVYDLLENRHVLNERPILMLHGEADSVISIEMQCMFYREAKDSYCEHPERLKLIEVPGVDHHTTMGMFELAVDWIKQYL